MLNIIDSAFALTQKIPTLTAQGVKVVIRYYNHANSKNLPSKRLERAEAIALSEAGFALAVVFEANGGKDGRIQDFSTATGQRDAAQALKLATALKQPQGSAIYFGVDWDFYKASDLAAIADYFAAVAQVLGTAYRTGVYGSGSVAKHLLAKELVALVWLAGARGWSGTQAFLATDRWALFQQDLERNEFGISYDGNIASPAHPDFGQFSLVPPLAVAAAPLLSTTRPLALMRVNARSGLKLRQGPGLEYAAVQTLAANSLVHALGSSGDWIKVDLEGDGIADGYMHAGYLLPVAGGLPLPAPAGSRPLDIARAELARQVTEIPGPGNNPQILLYHATTSLKATSDEVAWCSAFVNYCVSRAGIKGTDSAGARSWEHWGNDVTTAPEEGDVAVFSRSGPGVKPGSGHVGFWLSAGDNAIQLLGGNQRTDNGDGVSISTYPQKGKKGLYTYQLLSIRRT